jgi:hypothetical protein
MAEIVLKSSFWGHIKTLDLQIEHGCVGILALLKLWDYAAQHCPDGYLEGFDARKLSLVSGWHGVSEQFEKSLLKCGFLDEAENGYQLHDWEEHHRECIDLKESEKRQDMGRFSVLLRWNREVAEQLQGLGVDKLTEEDLIRVKLGHMPSDSVDGYGYSWSDIGANTTLIGGYKGPNRGVIGGYKGGNRGVIGAIGGGDESEECREVIGNDDEKCDVRGRKEEESYSYSSSSSSLKRRKEEEEEEVSPLTGDDAAAAPDLQLIKEFWNSSVEENRSAMPKLTKLTAGTKRGQMTQARYREYGAEDFMKALTLAAKSNFLNGRVREWRANYDWIVKPNNFAKVLEGNYSEPADMRAASNEQEEPKPVVEYEEWSLIPDCSKWTKEDLEASQRELARADELRKAGTPIWQVRQICEDEREAGVYRRPLDSPNDGGYTSGQGKENSNLK